MLRLQAADSPNIHKPRYPPTLLSHTSVPAGHRKASLQVGRSGSRESRYLETGVPRRLVGGKTLESANLKGVAGGDVEENG